MGSSGRVLLASGLAFPEGPLFAADGSLWCVELKGGALRRLAGPGGPAKIETGGAPNGLALGSDGLLYFADSGLGAIRRCDPATGRTGTMVEGLDGPNDLAFDIRGRLVFTCPGDSRVNPVGYVCCAESGGRSRVVSEGLNFPNGLAFSPDGSELFVAETYRRRIWRGRWDAEEGRWIDPRPWAATAGNPGPDGMAFGADGLLYVALFGAGTVAAFGPDGTVVGEYPTGGLNPTNVAFDPSGRLGLAATEAQRGEVLCFPDFGPGAQLPAGRLNGE